MFRQNGIEVIGHFFDSLTAQSTSLPRYILEEKLVKACSLLFVIVGEVAAKMLIEKVEHESEDEEEAETFRTEIVETTLIERGSTIN